MSEFNFVVHYDTESRRMAAYQTAIGLLKNVLYDTWEPTEYDRVIHDFLKSVGEVDSAEVFYMDQ